MQENTSENRFVPRARIFIVEDEALVLADLSERLTIHHYEVVGTALSGREAIEGIKVTEPDLILMDVQIQGELNGIEVAIIVQSFDKPPQVVFLTGFSKRAYPYLKALPDYIYLNKPFAEEELLAAIERALMQRKSDN